MPTLSRSQQCRALAQRCWCEQRQWRRTGRARRHHGITLSAPSMPGYSRTREVTVSWDVHMVRREECAEQHRGRRVQLHGCGSVAARHGRLFATGMRPQRDGRRGGGVAAYSCAFGSRFPKKLGGGESRHALGSSVTRVIPADIKGKPSKHPAG